MALTWCPYSVLSSLGTSTTHKTNFIFLGQFKHSLFSCLPDHTYQMTQTLPFFVHSTVVYKLYQKKTVDHKYNF
jgi:hypothetical protein